MTKNTLFWTVVLSTIALVGTLMTQQSIDAAHERGLAEGRAQGEAAAEAYVNDARVTCRHAEARCEELCARVPQDCIEICESLDRAATDRE